MSFSSDVKKELCSVRLNTDDFVVQCHGMLMLCRAFSFDKIMLQTGCVEVAEHFSLLLRHCFGVITAVIEGGSKRPTYRVEVQGSADRKRILHMLGYKDGAEVTPDFARIKNDGNIKAFIRGAFLSGGIVADPQKEYRVEFSFASNDVAADFITLLDTKGFDFSMTYRAGKFSVYSKNGTVMEEMLAYLGASSETLNLIGIKVYKSVRNKLNRQNNFETSNILKTADAAYVQTTAIKKLEKAGRLQTLPEELYKVAILRLNNPELSLSELCKLSEEGLTRSGINHRIRKLLQLAEEFE